MSSYEHLTVAEAEEVQELVAAEEVLEEAHGLAYLGWIGRTMARAPKLIAAQRWMAYASEGTEPFRPVASKWFVRSGYALSFIYVAADIGVRTRANYVQNQDTKKASIVFGDTLLFHSMASLIIPAVTIHQIVHLSSSGIKRGNILANMPRVRGLLPTLIGLMSIPFVVGPIDHGVEYLMDHTARKFYEHEEHEHNN